MLENLYKKEKTMYTKELLVKEMVKLSEKRDAYRGESEHEQVVFERKYIKSKIKEIRDAIKREVEKTIRRVSIDHRGDFSYIQKYTSCLKNLNNMWIATSDKLEMAVDEEFDLNTLLKASEDICEMVCSMENKDFRTYNMLPVWDVEKQTIGLPLAIQNYELVIDDYLNTLGSEGMKKFQKDLDGYATRERIDSKFEKYLERSVSDPRAIDLAMKCIDEGAYVDLKLEGEEFKFCEKPCTALSYLLMRRSKKAVISLLKHGANVNIKIKTGNGETFIPIVYAVEENLGHELIDLMLDNGARIDRTFLGINILERALQVKNNSFIMKLLNNGIEEYKYSTDIAKSVKKYLRESEDKKIIIGLYNNDMISLEDMMNLSKNNNNNAVLADVVKGLSYNFSIGRIKKAKRNVDKDIVTIGSLGLKVDVSNEKEFGLRKLPREKRGL